MGAIDEIHNYQTESIISPAKKAHEMEPEKYPSVSSSGIMAILRRSLKRFGILPEILDERVLSINSKIASLELAMRTPIFWDLGLVETFERELHLFIKLRDAHGMETVEEVTNSIQERKFSPKVVRGWIEEDLLCGSSLVNFVLRGYPEFWYLLSE